MLTALKPGVDASDRHSEEFVLDLGAPTRLDELGPRIAAMRREGVKWADIVEQTGSTLGNAYTAFKRCIDSDQAA